MRQSVTSSNRGSALIAVVALLMILALMGTAYLVVVRTDRQSGFAAGVVNNVGGFPAANPASLDAAQTIAADLVRKAIVWPLTHQVLTSAGPTLTVSTAAYRDPTPQDAASPNYWRHAESPSLFDYPRDSAFLASRYPESRVLLGGPSRGYWPYITGPLVDLDLSYTNLPQLTTYLTMIRLESVADLSAGAVGVPALPPPAYPNPVNANLANTFFDSTMVAGNPDRRFRDAMLPDSVVITYPAVFYPTQLQGKTRVFPALTHTGSDGVTVFRYLAADASGAGIADSGLFRLNIASDSMTWPDGNHPVTYWAAVRIIDNNAAVNVNTAWRTIDKDVAGVDIAAGTLQNGLLGAFRSNLSLETLGATIGDMTALDTLRFGQVAPARASTTPMHEATRTTRGDYTFDTQGDAMENQLARRLANPGWLDVNHRYTILPLTESANMAYQFGLYNPNVPQSQTEQTLSWSAVNRAPNFATSPQKAFAYYPSNADDIWFNTAYNDDFANLSANQRTTFLNSAAIVPTYSGAPAPGLPPLGLRSMLVNSNPLTTSIAPHSMVGNTVAGVGANQMTLFDAAYRNARKVSVNTGSFSDLWRAFWEVMCNDSAPTFPADGGLTIPYPRTGAEMFRSSMRYPVGGTDFSAQYEMYLRAAVAAVNTITMRSPAPVLPQWINGMQATVNSVAGTPVNVQIAGLKAQPYITEIYADTNSGSKLMPGAKNNANGYMAIEIHNPSSDIISLAGIRLVSYTRTATGLSHTAATDVNVRLTTDIPGCPLTLAPNGFIVIENVHQYTPVAVGAPVSPLSCATLDRAFGKELFLLRSAQLVEPATPNDAGWVALDAYDFTGVIVNTLWVAGVSQPVFSWHYVRQTQIAANTEWRCVYPGRYNVALTPRQEGTQTRTWGVKLDDPTEDDPGAVAWANPDGARGTAVRPVSLGTANLDASYTNTFRIPLVDSRLAMANPLSAAGNKFPFGAFGRDGDMLQIPFIGNYSVRNVADTAYIDLIPVTMDAAFADDTDDALTNNSVEQIGRLCSLKAFDPTYPAVSDTYAWANKLFDYLTAIHSPKDDMSPNVDPANYTANGGPAPVAVRNDTNVLPADEDLIPIHGLININTASWQVLNALPLVPGNPDQNRALAKAIVRYRDINDSTGNPHGAFKSIVELNWIPAYTAAQLNDTTPNLAFQLANGPVTGDFNQSQGELSGGAAGDGLLDTYKEHFLVLTRVSNLITTRSDSFTAYILIQAWQDAGTKFPVLLGERRSAYIFDRQAPTTATFKLNENALKETSVNTN